MNPASHVPLLLQCIAALVVMTEGMFLISWYSRQAERVRPASATLVAVYLSLWFAAAFVLGDSAHFPLPSESMRLPLSGLVAFGPFVAALLWALLSKEGRQINALVAPAALIAVQSYRMAGILFLYPNLAYGVLPSGFAWPAGVGDVLTGLAAPFVATALYRRSRGAVPLAIAWNLFGMLDLVVAPTAATLSHAQVLAMYPLSLVPLFVGPPMGILTHILSLRSLAVNRGMLRA